MRLEVINGTRDDLHDFAERFLNELTFSAMNGLCRKVVDCGPVQGAVLHQSGSYQVEFITFAPNLVIPPHTHPGTESIEYPIAGMATLKVGDFDPFKGMPERLALRMAKGRGLRIPEHAVHSGTISDTGAMILSFQRWSVPMAHIGQNWKGDYSCDTHKKIGDDYANL